jgi:hypothetical protein
VRQSAVLSIGVIVGLWLPRLAVAQGNSYFAVLSTPPVKVGTCRPMPPPKRPEYANYQGRRLVIKSTPPGRSREMTLIGDPRGRTAVYSEMTSAASGLLTDTSFDVIAFVDTVRGVSGYQTRTITTVPESLFRRRFDSTTLRTMREQSKTDRSRHALNADEQRRVRDLAAFLRKRCPA